MPLCILYQIKIKFKKNHIVESFFWVYIRSDLSNYLYISHAICPTDEWIYRFSKYKTKLFFFFFLIHRLPTTTSWRQTSFIQLWLITSNTCRHSFPPEQIIFFSLNLLVSLRFIDFNKCKLLSKINPLFYKKKKKLIREVEINFSFCFYFQFNKVYDSIFFYIPSKLKHQWHRQNTTTHPVANQFYSKIVYDPFYKTSSLYIQAWIKQQFTSDDFVVKMS